MKTLKRLAFISSLIVLLVAGCTKDFEEINTDPNNSVSVATASILTYAQKIVMDNLRDEWFGGRCTQLLAQYWSQRNYSDEDRYAFRTAVDNGAWGAFYRGMMNLQNIIDLNTNEFSKADAAKSGPNVHQIAVAKILQAWIMSIITDTWGDVPYSEAVRSDIIAPSYDKQEDIYAGMILTLKEAAAMIDPSLPNGGKISGDIIYSGDMTKWIKFANSLRLRLALRVRHKTATYWNEVIALPASSFFESNDDNAYFKYVDIGTSQGPIYRAFFVSYRNDFTITKPLVELLAGRSDSLNAGKDNPFEGVFDPRLEIWSYPNDVEGSPYYGQWVGMPYGMVDTYTKQFAQHCPDYQTNPSIIHEAVFNYSLMEYSEVCFIMSEGNSWNQTWYENGIRASMERWGVATADIDSYIAAIPAADQENVLTQKYIAFYMIPEQAWFEWRRTGFPKTLIIPGEISHYHDAQGNLLFTVLDGEGIPRRMRYPLDEQGVNNAKYLEAVAQQGPDNLTTRVWWDKP